MRIVSLSGGEKTPPFLRNLFLVAAIVAMAALFIAACGDDDDDDNGDGNGETPTEAAEETPTEAEDGNGAEETPTEAEDGDNGDGATGEMNTDRTVEVGLVPGWAEGVAATYLWEHIMTEQGYTVEITNLEVATTFAGVAQGDIDLYFDAWLPATHEEFMNEFGDDINELSTWYEPADLYLTVPSYVDATSLEDLSGMADQFGSTITGIEAGAGMMGIARDSVMPAYGLEDWTLQESSTPAMLSELESAIENEQPIVVTLWSPGWWYAEWDLTNLEDPQDAWPEPDHLAVISTTDFTDQYPVLSGWIESFEMSDEQLSTLENLIRDAGDGNEADAVDTWLEDQENQELVDGWTGGGGG